MVLLPRFISTMAFFIVRHQKNPFFVDFFMNFSIICAAFQISMLISIKIFETRKSKYFFVRSWFALRYISKRTLLERSLGQALEFNTKSYPVKSILI